MDAGRGERVWRERERGRVRESRTRQGEGKPRGLLKKFYLVGALRPLRRYRTPVRCCWPRWCRAASSPTSCESKESERAEREIGRERRERGREFRSCAAVSGPGRSVVSFRPPAREEPDRRGRGARRASSAGREGSRTSLEESVFLRSSLAMHRR